MCFNLLVKCSGHHISFLYTREEDEYGPKFLRSSESEEDRWFPTQTGSCNEGTPNTRSC